MLLSLAILAGCTSGRVIETLQSGQQDSARQLIVQEEQLELQRLRLSELASRNRDLTEALFDLQQEIETIKHNNQRQQTQSSAKTERKTPSSPKDSSTAAEPLLDPSGKVILGTSEWVWFDVMGRSVEARVDDKLKASAIYANAIQLFERDGDQWVRFTPAPPEAAGTIDDRSTASYESPLLRKVRVRLANGDETESRPIIKLKVKLGDLVEDTEFTLVNREVSDFPVTLGRSFLQDIAVVDEKRKYTQSKLSENTSL